MSVENNLHYRYPGPFSFKDDDVDRYLFYGREQEIEQLLHRICAHRLLVLFGKSGLGKTSLLQAGLYPQLRDQHLLPVPVRLNHPDIDPLEAVFEAVHDVCRQRNIDYEPANQTGLWEYFKTTDFWSGETLQTPVLIFDQFEEIFTLQTPTARGRLAAALWELTSRGVPARVRQQGEKRSYSDALPAVKVVLSLREEYVGALEALTEEMPVILEQRFRLTPLDRPRAELAITMPAQRELAGVFSRPFKYEAGTLKAMVDFLANEQGEVEPFQLQLICQHAERQVIERQKNLEQVIVDPSLLGSTKVMGKLLRSFYRNALRKLPFGRQRTRARRLCERGFLSPDGHRVSMEQGQIRKQYKVKQLCLEALTETRLIRKESRPGLKGFYYELSHDSVARAVLKSRRLYLPNWAKLALFILVVMLLAAVNSYQSYKSTTERQIAAQEQEIAAKEQQVVEQQVQKEQLRETATQALESTRGVYAKEGLLVPEMVVVPAGDFLMGDFTAKRKVVQKVQIRKPFAIGKYEVTFKEYDQFALATERSLPDDEGWGRGDRPVINVTWDEANAYTDWISQQTGRRFRLPSEAEWEYAARGGGKEELWAGTSNLRLLRDFAWYQANSKGQTHSVGQKKPNALGLNDLSGNVAEWLQDCWSKASSGAPVDGSAREEGDCQRRLIRGGSWNTTDDFLRVFLRGESTIRYKEIGFRVAQEL